MQIVIDIPEEKYNMVKTKMYCGIYDAEVYKAIANGVLFSKGHGRIIDENKITKCEQVGIVIKDGNITHCIVTDAPTIIEAESEEV